MRLEKDCIGEMFVPDDALYGIHSLRAKQNFPITREHVNSLIIESYLQIKKAAALANQQAGTLNKEKAAFIISACNQLLLSKDFRAMIVPAIQGGAGTSTNMNINEVVANLAMKISGEGSQDPVSIHPNDDVNQSQSTNDTYPTAGKMAMLKALDPLEDMLKDLTHTLEQKAEAYRNAIKVGRTQLQDAVPTTFGRSFQAYSSMFKRDLQKMKSFEASLEQVNLGGTAIGTGLNASVSYRQAVTPILSQVSHLSLTQSDDLVDATQNSDVFAGFSAILKGLAINLSKFCNDLRLLASGPQAGLAELSLPKVQAGSSIMPGKVNPVIPEVVNQVAFEIIGKDLTVTMAAESGQLELNAFEPMIFRELLISEDHLTKAIQTLIENCVTGIKVNLTHCQQEVDHSSITATILSPYLGYEQTTALIKKSEVTHTSVKQVVKMAHLLPDSLIDSLFSPEVLTNAKPIEPSESGSFVNSNR
ncbi:aspartate ammonia-lyase [Lentilactobacillus hilgardii]|uniref:aspartate ammonia-lyase n=1 Tax=Lentilactobacillus hilgardii TaxID=1588 RepID=UPI0021A5C4BA|nr:aspartate ammonia-lyase [Lentilactobacillus hilgardii]MCT3400301.1 aspartate ammonia-lyase [Lentilactobacillus hilgardii]